MKKSVQTIYFILMGILIVAPCLLWQVIRSHVDTNNYENRSLSEFPVLPKETIGQFPGQFDSWLNDHLPYRNQLLTLNGLFDYKVLQSSSNESVIVGKNGWLFYKGAQVNDEDPIADYQGTNLFTDEELAKIKENLELAQYLLSMRENPSQFIVYIAPNKERVFPEFVPDSYGEPQYGRMQQVIDYLRENTTIPVVTPYDDLMAFKEEHPEYQIFFKYDTHWNELGAYIGAKSLVEQLGKTQPDISELKITDVGMGSFDLARLMHLGQVLNKDHAYALEGYTPYNIVAESNDAHNEYRFYNSESNADIAKLMIIGDSFSSFLAPYIACHYNNSYDVFYYNYAPNQIEQEAPNIVVYEQVERYLGNMVNFDFLSGIGKKDN